MNTVLFAYPALSTLFALMLYFFLAWKVGQARGKFGVKLPHTEGPEEFMRRYRTHMNTLEQLVLFLPALWIFALYVSPKWAGALGMVWVLARAHYAYGYYQAVEKRLPGFLVAILVTVVLIAGGLYGVIGAMMVAD